MALLVTVIFVVDALLESFLMSFSSLSHLSRARLFQVRCSHWITGILSRVFPVPMFHYFTIISVRISKLNTAILSNLVKEKVSKEASFCFVFHYSLT